MLHSDLDDANGAQAMAAPNTAGTESGAAAVFSVSGQVGPGRSDFLMMLLD